MVRVRVMVRVVINSTVIMSISGSLTFLACVPTTYDIDIHHLHNIHALIFS